MWGVSLELGHYTGKPAPKEVMKALAPIYKKTTGMQCLEIYFRLVFAFRFRFMCECGSGRPAKLLQRIVGVTADGSIGPMTLARSRHGC